MRKTGDLRRREKKKTIELCVEAQANKVAGSSSEEKNEERKTSARHTESLL